MSNQTDINKSTLLIELGTEELPPKSLKKLGEAFSSAIFESLLEAQIVDTPCEANLGFTSYAAPRRLAIAIPNVAEKQATQNAERRGPAVQAAFKEDGSATPAALGFAKSCGTEIDQLSRLKTDKGEWLYFEQKVEGKPAIELINDAIDVSIKKLPIAKRMRWGAGSAEFVRPAKWLTVLHGDTVLPISVLGIDSSNTSRGHRFHSDGDMVIPHADDYADSLEKNGTVIAHFDLRQTQISEQIATLAKSVNGNIVDDQALLDEVTGLVEYPNALIGKIDDEFMSVPQECLVSSMRDHQKYFHLVDDSGKLLPYFITVSNIKSKNPAQVISGNERVLRARLSDAKFFWDTDKKSTLASRTQKLESVLFHKKLGSIANKVSRLTQVAKTIAKDINADVSIAERGAQLAKADLVSDMVGEFPELQGVMGHYYADHDNEPQLVGECIEQHYWPKFAGDQLPNSPESQSVSLADKLDGLVGIFAAGEIPTGDKDPYGLRRSALGILRILIEEKLTLSLPALVATSAESYSSQGINVSEEQQQQIVNFLFERLRAYYQPQGISTNRINAVLACRPESPLDFDHRLRALNEFMALEEATNLAAANKRISNILKKTDAISGEIDTSLLEDGAETVLAHSVADSEKTVIALFNSGDYNGGLKQLATLKDAVDTFFDGVMVMAEDEEIRTNRLRLLKKLQNLFLRVADISAL